MINNEDNEEAMEGMDVVTPAEQGEFMMDAHEYIIRVHEATGAVVELLINGG